MKVHSFVVAALFAASSLFAQEPAAGAAAPPDPKHPQHDALRAFVGDWQVTMKMEAMPGVPGMEKPTECSGTEHAELTCNGLFLKSVLDSTWQGQPFQGVWIVGYDPFQKTYSSVWVSSDAEECGATTMNGSYDAKTQTWTWSGTTPHGDMRSVLAMHGNDRSVETCFLKGPDGKEAKCMEITRTRAKMPAAVPVAAAAKKDATLPAEHQRLLQDVGTWDAVVTMEGAPAADKATETIGALCNDRWLWSDFKGTFAGQPFEGHGLFGYDPTSKQYVSFWFDTMSPVWAKTAGTFDPKTRTYTLTGSTVDPHGKPMQIKETMTCKDDDTRVLAMEFKGAGEPERMQIHYTRKGKATR